MVDMTKYLKRWLDLRELAQMRDTYEGVIADVLEEEIRNKFTATREQEPILVFEDGWRLCPNLGMRQTLVEFWGWDTDEWIGRRLVVYFRQTSRRPDHKPGQLQRGNTTRWPGNVAAEAAGITPEAGRSTGGSDASMSAADSWVPLGPP